MNPARMGTWRIDEPADLHVLSLEPRIPAKMKKEAI